MSENGFAAFISYSSRDAATALELCRLLESRGLSCWIAPRNVVGGREYADEIMRGLAASASAILLVSSNSNVSKHVLREVEQIIRLGKPLFPILLEKIHLAKALDYYIAPIHWIEITSGGLGAGADTLAAAINGDPNWTEAALAPSFGRRLRYRRDAFLMSFAGAALVAGLMVMAAVLLWVNRSHSIQRSEDRNYLTFGWVHLEPARSEAGKGKKPVFDAVASIYVSPTVRFSEVTLRTAGMEISDSTNGDLSSLFDRRGIGEAQQVFFLIDGLGNSVVTCLGMPHPRTGKRIRVTQVFAPRHVLSENADVVEFAKSGAEVVSPDDDTPCIAR